MARARVAESENNLDALAEEFNESQDEVQVLVRNQGVAYDEVLRKYVAAIPSRQLPGIVYLEDTTLRQVVDSGTVLPAEACEEADDFSTGQLPAVRNYYTSEGVYWPGYTNVSEPVLYYNANHFRRAGLDPEDPPADARRAAGGRRRPEGGRASRRRCRSILNAWFVESWINGAGASVVNKGNGREGLADESTFDNEVTHELYTWIKEMADDGLLQGHSATDGPDQPVPRRRPAELVDADRDEHGGDHHQGGARWRRRHRLRGGVDLSKIVPVDGALPRSRGAGPGAGVGRAFFMTNTVPPEQQAAAWEFMKFMWQTESQVDWHLVARTCPPRRRRPTPPR